MEVVLSRLRQWGWLCWQGWEWWQGRWWWRPEQIIKVWVGIGRSGGVLVEEFRWGQVGRELGGFRLWQVWLCWCQQPVIALGLRA